MLLIITLLISLFLFGTSSPIFHLEVKGETASETKLQPVHGIISFLSVASAKCQTKRQIL